MFKFDASIHFAYSIDESEKVFYNVHGLVFFINECLLNSELLAVYQISFHAQTILPISFSRSSIFILKFLKVFNNIILIDFRKIWVVWTWTRKSH